MAQTLLRISTFNLLNLNEPGLPLYRNSKPWTETEYARKIAFTADILRQMPSDVIGFQELWHRKSLLACLDAAGLETYAPLVPAGHEGDGIACAAALRQDILVGDPEWIKDFPAELHLSSGGDDAQTEGISVSLSSFSRPVLHFKIQPLQKASPIHVYVCHLKSKGPTLVLREPWYERGVHAPHSEAIGAAISTIRRTAEATALRVILTDRLKNTDEPVVVLGDVNDGTLSNTLNILTGQPNYLMGFSQGGSDTDLYTVQTLQEYRSTRDVYYTHIFQNNRESLDQILVSQEFYDNSRRRIWSFDGLDVANDHLNFGDHRERGSNDHGIVRATFKYDPIRQA